MYIKFDDAAILETMKEQINKYLNDAISYQLEIWKVAMTYNVNFEDSVEL